MDGRTVNKRSIEALIKCGAFGSTGATRKGMLEVLDSAQAAGQRTQQDAQMGQGSIFDLFDAGPADTRRRSTPRPTRRSRSRSTTATSCWRWRRSRSASSSPSTRSSACARR